MVKSKGALMINRTQAEVEAKMEELWPDKKYCDTKREAKKVPEGWNITASDMYEAPSLSLKQLLSLAEFFGTKSIEDERFSSGGCETCDYGSCYGFTLEVRHESR